MTQPQLALKLCRETQNIFYKDYICWFELKGEAVGPSYQDDKMIKPFKTKYYDNDCLTRQGCKPKALAVIESIPLISCFNDNKLA